jgi:hypothetical protein
VLRREPGLLRRLEREAAAQVRANPGHTSVLLEVDGDEVLFVGDNAYTLRHLAVDGQVRQVTIAGAATAGQVDSIRRTREKRGER